MSNQEFKAALPSCRRSAPSSRTAPTVSPAAGRVWRLEGRVRSGRTGGQPPAARPASVKEPPVPEYHPTVMARSHRGAGRLRTADLTDARHGLELRACASTALPRIIHPHRREKRTNSRRPLTHKACVLPGCRRGEADCGARRVSLEGYAQSGGDRSPPSAHGVNSWSVSPDAAVGGTLTAAAVPARGPGAGAVPGRRGACWAVRPPRPLVVAVTSSDRSFPPNQGWPKRRLNWPLSRPSITPSPS